MEFGIAFVLGGVSTGVTVANWGRIRSAIVAWVSNIRSAIQSKVDAKITELKSKL
jgi:hypothetical protein